MYYLNIIREQLLKTRLCVFLSVQIMLSNKYFNQLLALTEIARKIMPDTMLHVILLLLFSQKVSTVFDTDRVTSIKKYLIAAFLTVETKVCNIYWENFQSIKLTRQCKIILNEIQMLFQPKLIGIKTKRNCLIRALLYLRVLFWCLIPFRACIARTCSLVSTYATLCNQKDCEFGRLIVSKSNSVLLSPHGVLPSGKVKKKL